MLHATRAPRFCGLFALVSFVAVGGVASACVFDPTVPADAALSCSSDDDCRVGEVCVDALCGAPDVVPPGQLLDLAVDLAATTDTHLALVFTVPTDEGGRTSTPARYRVHLSVQGEPAAATTPEFPAVAAAGARERLELDDLAPGRIYDIVVDVIDRAGNVASSPAVSAETGGALCVVDAATGKRTARAATFTITRPEHLVRLYGCEVIDGSLEVVDQECEITQLHALAAVETITGGLAISGNALCGRGLADLSDLAALTEVSSVLLQDNGVLVDASLDATIAGFVTVIRNPVLTHLALPQANGTVNVDDNPRLQALTVSMNGTVSLTRNPQLADAELTGATGTVTVEAPALTRLSLPNWQDGSLAVHDAAVLTTLTTPVWRRADDVDLAGLPLLSAVEAPDLVDVTTRFAVADAPALRTLTLGAPHTKEASLTSTALTALPAVTAERLVVAHNEALIDVSAAQATVSASIRDNGALDPCDVLTAVVAWGITFQNIDIDAPTEACPVGTPGLSCPSNGFDGALPAIVVEGDDALFALRACAHAEGNLVVRSVSSLAPLQGMAVVDGVLRIEQSPVLSAVRLPSLTQVGSVVIDGANDSAIAGISLPALTHTTALGGFGGAGGIVLSRLPALTSLSLPALTSTANLSLSELPQLATTTWPALNTTSTLSLSACPALASVSAPTLTAADTVSVVDVAALAGLELPALEALGSLQVVNAPLLTRLSLGDLSDDTLELTIVDAPALVDLDALSTVRTASSVRLLRLGAQNLSALDGITALNDLEADVVPACDVFAFAADKGLTGEHVTVPLVDVDDNGVFDVDETTCAGPTPSCDALVAGHTAACSEVGGLETDVNGDLPGTTDGTLHLPNLRVVGSVHITVDLFASFTQVPNQVLDAPVLERVSNLSVLRSRMAALSLPALRQVDGRIDIGDNPLLTRIELPALETVLGNTFITLNPALTSVELGDFAGPPCLVELPPALCEVPLPASCSRGGC